LDSSGSYGPTGIKPDVEHAIQFKKQYFEDSPVLHKQAPVKQTITISTEAKLKQFGTLAFTRVDPPETALTIQGSGVPPQRADRTNPTPLPEGTYTVRGNAGDQYQPFQQDVQIHWGQPTSIAVSLTPKPPPETKPLPKQEKKAPPPVVQLTDLFRGDPKHWQRDPQGFWTHDNDEAVWIKDQYFGHIFQVFLKKGLLGTAKLQWRTLLDESGDNYFEFELSDRELKRREVVDKKQKDWEKPKAHGIAQGGQYILRITIKPDQIENSIGEATDIINRKVDGLTGFYGKVALKLIQQP
jgi:hypothetical protein